MTILFTQKPLRVGYGPNIRIMEHGGVWPVAGLHISGGRGRLQAEANGWLFAKAPEMFKLLREIAESGGAGAEEARVLTATIEHMGRPPL